MNHVYNKIIKQIVISGKRLKSKAGKIKDIGITKKYLTKEDIRIERELKKIVKENNPQSVFYAEEENERFFNAKDVWVVDPISGTHVFILGLPHYGIVVSHLKNQKVQFAAVYDPSADDLYTAYHGKGAFYNNHRIEVKDPGSEKLNIIFNLSIHWKNPTTARKVFSELSELSKYELYRVMGCHSENESMVARGIYNGVISLTKDSFPHFASSLIIKEAGGIYTNIKGEENIKPTDRIFIGGDKKTYKKLKSIVTRIFKK